MSTTSGRAGWTEVWMDTFVTIQLGVPAEGAGRWATDVERAFRWFAAVEAVCSRFDPDSEVSRLALQVGRPVPVSPLLGALLRLALILAADTGGAFDPAIGHRLEAAGYDRDYRTGRRHRSSVPPAARPSWRDLVLEVKDQADPGALPGAETVTLRRPLLLDLGGLAKGLAVDLAALELSGTPGAAVDAGGDVSVHGTDVDGRPWQVGVAHPGRPGALLGTVEMADGAVATSGCYARGAHLVDPRPAAGRRGQRPIAVTVFAPTATAADGLSTAATVLDLDSALELLEHTQDVTGLLVTAGGQLITTGGLGGDWTP